MKERELILGIETSCDETSAAILLDNKEILSNVISSQIEVHRTYGGVMPEIASRLHLENIDKVLNECFNSANIKPEELTAVAVTGGPGLIGALHVGMIAAKTIAAYNNIPLISVHHLAGHIYANEFASPLVFPCLAVIVSGGNTELVIMDKHLSFKIIGETLDDAIGESFDKVARVLGLPYPGGVAIDKLVKNHDLEPIYLPKPKVSGYNVSYSGIKSHIIRETEKLKKEGKLDELMIERIAMSAEHAFSEQLIGKIKKVLKDFRVEQIVVGGGVSANSYLRKRVKEEFESQYQIVLPPLWCTTDNALMIAKVGHYMLKEGKVSSFDVPSLATRQLE